MRLGVISSLVCSAILAWHAIGPPDCSRLGECRKVNVDVFLTDPGHCVSSPQDVNRFVMFDAHVVDSYVVPKVFKSTGGIDITVTRECILGVCTCCYLLGGKTTQLKPCIHSIGAVMKPDRNVRPITDCSRPEGDCLNDNMEDMHLKFT